MNKGRRFVTTVLALAFGLSAQAETWRQVGSKPVSDSRYGFSVQLPANWKKSSDATGLVFSLHGLDLDKFRISFEQRKFSPPEPDPLVLARRMIASLESRQDLGALELGTLEQITLQGRPAFRAEATSTRTLFEHVRYRHVLYGVAGTDGDYLLMYSAPAIHYFEDSLPVIESAIAGFEFK